MDPRALEIRNLTYRTFVELGRAPTADQVAAAAGLSRADVDAAWAELHEQHALVLNPVTSEIQMANPFAAPTAYRVRAGSAGGTATALGTRSESVPLYT